MLIRAARHAQGLAQQSVHSRHVQLCKVDTLLLYSRLLVLQALGELLGGCIIMLLQRQTAGLAVLQLLLLVPQTSLPAQPVLLCLRRQRVVSAM